MIRVIVTRGDGKTTKVCYDYASEALVMIEELVSNAHEPRTERIVIEFEDDE